MIKISRLVIFFLLISCAVTVAAPLEKKARREHEGAVGKVLVTISNDTISVADSIKMTLEVQAPPGYSARLPSFADYGFSTGFDERSRRFRATSVGEIKKIHQSNDSTTYTQQFLLEPWLSGNYSILPLMVSFYKNTAGKDKTVTNSSGDIPTFSVMTEGVRIEVKPLPPERRKLSDLFGQSALKQDKPWKKERRLEDKSDNELQREKEQKREAALALRRRSFPWSVLLALLAACLLLPAIWYATRTRIKKHFAVKKSKPHETACNALAELRKKHLPEDGKMQEYYYELSYILREYIGNRFQIYALNQTTEEFFRHLLESNPFQEEAEQILRDFSDHADTVKYSLYRPDIDRAEECLAIVESFVGSTKNEQEEA